jgi:hypothetical protein
VGDWTALDVGGSNESLTGEDGRDEEKKLVKLFDLRRGTKVFGLLDGDSTPAGTPLEPMSV